MNAQQRDPRIGEWREDRTANSVGLYNIFEDLGNGMIRYHISHNLAPENRLYLDYRCDGNFYPIRNAQSVAPCRTTPRISTATSARPMTSPSNPTVMSERIASMT